MYTHCPHCDTCFRVTSEQLKTAQGSVRCGRCFGTFNALDHLVDQSPDEDKKQNTPPEVTAIVGSAPAMATPAGAATPAVSAANVERSQQLLEEIQATPIKPKRSFFWLWLFLALILATVIAGQYIYFNINTLSQNLKLRPMLHTLCDAAPCEVPLMRSPHLIALVERDIRNHPDEKDILLVKAKIINKAPYPQAFPQMGLSLHDITGQSIAERRFKPNEYLSSDMDISKGIAPKQTVDITLELIDPGEEAVGFEFGFF